MAEELRRVKTFVGATGRVLKFQLRDSTGEAIDLTDYTAAVISGANGETEQIQRETCDIQTGTDGWLHYTPSATAVGTTGDVRCNIKLTKASTTDYTSEFIIEVATVHDYAAA